jgi:hypothetical protein
VVYVTIQENNAYIHNLQLDNTCVYVNIKVKGMYRLENKARQVQKAEKSDPE